MDERSRLLLDASPNMIIMFDSSLKVVDCNPVAQKFLGFETKEELLTGFLERVARVTPPFQPDGKPSPSLYEHLHTAVKKGHSEYETEIHIGGKLNLNVILKKVP